MVSGGADVEAGMIQGHGQEMCLMLSDDETLYQRPGLAVTSSLTISGFLKTSLGIVS